MCMLCHSSLSDEAVLAQMREVHNFEKWNTGSLASVIYAASGMNGKDAHDVAIDVLERFVQWLSEQPEDYFPSCGLERFPPLDEIRKTIAKCKELSEEDMKTIKDDYDSKRTRMFSHETFRRNSTESVRLANEAQMDARGSPPRTNRRFTSCSMM